MVSKSVNFDVIGNSIKNSTKISGQVVMESYIKAIYFEVLKVFLPRLSLLCFICLLQKKTISYSKDSYPPLKSQSGSYQCKIGERLFDSLFLFLEVLTFEKAKEYRNSYGRYLRRNQWRDIEVEVWMVI